MLQFYEFLIAMLLYIQIARTLLLCVFALLSLKQLIDLSFFFNLHRVNFHKKLRFTKVKYSESQVIALNSKQANWHFSIYMFYFNYCTK